MKIFLVEDDPIITEGLKIALSQEGYQVDACANMHDALGKIKEEVHYDVCLLDVMLPDGDGYQICRAIREKSDVPILFLTACDDEVHTVLALEQGADDYIAKPFRIRELLARIKAILRRSGKSTEGIDTAASSQQTTGQTSGQLDLVRIGQNELNLSTGRVLRGGEEILLSAAEYRLLLTFVRSRGQLLTRAQILNDMWDAAGEFVNDNTLTVYVGRLRKKLEAEGDVPVIETVRGIGYRMP
ncbi:MAG: response regulator transcription factor [Firmicutes bacterium]|nr:response regulator transcription factor [Bacillota bacterium]